MKKNFYNYNALALVTGKPFRGWGRKHTGMLAVWLARIFNRSYVLMEDGFIRSVDLGCNDASSFSYVEDDEGIYYDATVPSKLERILLNHDFKNDTALIEKAKNTIELIKSQKISKYNHTSLKLPKALKTDSKRVLIIAQTKGDMSLHYGLADEDPEKMILDAVTDNPNAEIYIKVHPDVINGKKRSNIDLDSVKEYCKLIYDDIHPIILLEAFEKVYTQTSQMGFEALLLGKEVHLYGMPFYAGWDLPNLIWHPSLFHLSDKKKKSLEAACRRRNRRLTFEEVFAGAYLLYARYVDPHDGTPLSCKETIRRISHYRDMMQSNTGRLYFFGFSQWKHRYMLPFFNALGEQKIFFCRTLEDALERGLDEKGKIYIWGKKIFESVEQYACSRGMVIYRVEDGFVRSVALGSDLTRPYSIVVDSRGIYFDPTSESDLEVLLNHYCFDDTISKRAKVLQNYLIEKRISKYNIHGDRIVLLDKYQDGQKIILVPGQVEDDASIVYGADGMSNLALLEAVRKRVGNAYIIYKPHPDVLVGNRRGHIEPEVAKIFADTIIADISLDSILSICDEVHTITSLVGFEALLRNKRVFTYGMPFYAGWGLTEDIQCSSRRKRKLKIEELIAAVYILYPRYIHPRDHSYCEVESLLKEIDKEKNRYNRDIFYRVFVTLRHHISRKLQRLAKVFIGE